MKNNYVNCQYLTCCRRCLDMTLSRVYELRWCFTCSLHSLGSAWQHRVQSMQLSAQCSVIGRCKHAWPPCTQGARATDPNHAKSHTHAVVTQCTCWLSRPLPPFEYAHDQVAHACTKCLAETCTSVGPLFGGFGPTYTPPMSMWS